MVAIKYPMSQQLICRLHLADLKRSIIDQTLWPLSRALNEILYKIFVKALNKSDWVLRFQNGSSIAFSGLGNTKQVEKVLGTEYCNIFPNECTQLHYDVFTKLKTRLSQNVIGLKNKMILDCNPTIVTSWVHDLFVKHIDPEDKHPKNPSKYGSLLMLPTDNPHLPADYIDDILGELSIRQQKRFRYGLWLDEVLGALWSQKVLDKSRDIELEREKYEEVFIAWDPNTTNNKLSNEAGIILIGKVCDEVSGRDITEDEPLVHVIQDYSGNMSPKEAGRKIVDLYHEWKCSTVVAEINQGGDMVEDILKMIDRTVHVTKVRAATAKFARAEPIVSLYEQEIYIKHVNPMPLLESQMTTWINDGRSSPDRIDALVWGMYYIFMEKLHFFIMRTDGGITSV